MKINHFSTKDFFKEFRFWYEDAKKEECWSGFRYNEGRLRGLNLLAWQTGLISFNTSAHLDTLIRELVDTTIEKGLSN